MFHLSTIVLVIMSIVNIGTWLTLTEYIQFNGIYSISLAIAFLAYLYFFRARFKDLYESNWFKQFANVLTTCVLFLVFLGFANYLGFKNVKIFDLSGRHLHSLPPEMSDILEKLDAPLSVKVVSPSHSFNAFTSYMSQLKAVKRDIDIEFIQPHLRPDILKQYQIEAEQSVILNYKQKQDIITSFTHLDFAHSFKRLLDGKVNRVVFANNHNGASILNTKGNGISKFNDFLKQAGVEVAEMDLRSSLRHDQFETLFIWGPQVDFTSEELSFLDQLVLKKKNIVLAIDPSVKADNVPLLRKWSEKYGVGVKNSFVIDNYSYVNGSKGTVPLVQEQWGGKEFFKLKFPIFFPLSSHIEALPIKDESLKGKVKIEPLLVSTKAPHSWAEMNHAEMIAQNYLFNKGSDVAGPVTLAALAEIENQGQILLLGNSKLIENNYAQFKNNFDFLVKGIDHMNITDGELNLTMPMVEETPLYINGIQLKLIFYLTIFIFPFMGMLTAYYVYRIRLRS